MPKLTDLPDELLVLILEKLVAADCIRFGAACMSLNLTLRKEKEKHCLFRPMMQQQQLPPWLMFAGDNNESANFFSLSEQKIYKVPQRGPMMLRRRICYGSSYGWLITVDPTCQVHLVNPITSAQIKLPPVETLPFVDAIINSKGRLEYHVVDDSDSDAFYTTANRETRSRRRPIVNKEKEMRSYLFEKAVLSSAPCTSSSNSSSGSGAEDHSDSDFTVMIIYHPGWRLAFTRAGDVTWSALRTQYPFDDIIHCKGQFYAITSHGMVLVFDTNPEDNGFKPRRVIGNKHFLNFDIGSKYLVESLTGGLMMVMRDRDGCNDHSLQFKLFLFDHDRDEETGGVSNKWLQVKNDMGDNVIFIGLNQSMSVDASKSPELRRNCIYYTDDFFATMDFHRNEPRDMGIFDIGDKTIVKLKDFLPSHFNWPPPVWLTPSIL